MVKAFISGVGSVLNLFGSGEIEFRRCKITTDSAAIKSDFKAVGSDMSVCMGKMIGEVKDKCHAQSR